MSAKIYLDLMLDLMLTGVNKLADGNTRSKEEMSLWTNLLEHQGLQKMV